MVVSDNGELNITGDMEASGGLRLNNNRQKLRQRFDIVRKLGQGTYGKVQLALNKDTGEEVAIKTIKKAKIETEQDLIRIQREIQIMSSVQHPHIIHIYEVFENKEKIVLVMEYASGGELYDYLSYKKSLGECEARRIFRQIVSAVYYCHKNKICHRDLKLENILLDEKGNTKIADFGLSNVFDEQRMLSTFCGSPLYASPEIVKGTPYYGPEVDCWSLGVLLYTLVYGAMPFDGSNFRRLVKQISEGDYYEPKQPSEASSLIRRMLTVVPSKRATIEEVCTDWWVNLGYQDSLLTMAEEMCQAMPVRLDYLLTLVPPTIPQSVVNSEEVNTNKSTAVIQDPITIKEIVDDLATKDVVMEEAVKPMEAEEEVENMTRKHKLTSSMKSLTSDSSEKLGTSKKKQKRVDKQEISLNKSEVKIAAQSDAMEQMEKPNETTQNIEPLKNEMRTDKCEVNEVLQSSQEAVTEERIIPDGTSEAVNKEENFSIEEVTLKPTQHDTSDESKNLDDSISNEILVGKKKATAESESSKKQIKPSKTDKAKKSSKVETVKSSEKISDAQKISEKVTEVPKASEKTIEPVKLPDKAAEVSKLPDKKMSEVSKEKEAEKNVSPPFDSDVAKIEILKEDVKSDESKKEESEEKKKSKSKTNKSTTPSKTENEPPTAFPGRRGSKTIEEKKLLFPALKVSEARKAFENKPAEKKSLVIPGLKVSAARKAFEIPPSSAASTSSVTAKNIPLKVSAVKSKESNGTVVVSNSSNENIQKHKNDTEAIELIAGTVNDDKETSEKLQKKDDSSAKAQPEVKAEGVKIFETKEISSSSQQQKVAGFVPTLDVSMAVKPSKRTIGKPPAAPRTPADTSGTSSGENTPDISKISSSPLAKGPLRKPPIGKSSSKETNIVNSSPSSPDNEEDVRKKFQGASSKDICGSESSFLARAFMNKNSESPLQSPTSIPNEAFGAEVKKSSSAEDKPKVMPDASPTTKAQKISTVEIHLSDSKSHISKPVESIAQPTDTTLKVTEPVLELPEPQPTLVRSSTPGKFTLLGVTSEVCFNVDVPSEEVETITASLPAPSHTLQSLYMNVTLPPPPPASPSPSPEVAKVSENQQTEASPVPSENQKIAAAPTKTTEQAGGNVTKERIIPVQLEGNKSENLQQGYNVYRSKFCSGYNSRLGESSRYRAPSLERSESLSSTGSIDDLEDSFFDNVAGDSMLSGILARTRSILEELTRDDSSRRFGSFFSRTGGSSSSASYRSDPFRDSFPKRDWFSDITSGFGSRLSRDSTGDSFSSRSKSNKTWRPSGSSHSSAHDNEAYLSDSGIRTRKNKSNLSYFTHDDDYMSDSSMRSASARRSAYSSYSRSISRSISEEESHSVNSSRSSSYSSSINKIPGNNDNTSTCYSRSTSRESAQQDASNNSSSRSNSQRRSSWSNRTTPISSLDSGSSASTVTYASQEKDNFANNGSGSYYKYDTKGNKEHLSHNRSSQTKESKDEHRSRSRSCYESAMDEITSLYGTIRRPKSLLRYTKSLTKDELGSRRSSSIDEFDNVEESLLKRMHRPRSILVLADPDADNKEEDDSSASSDPPRDRFHFPRDDLSRGGGSSGNQRSSRRDGAGRNSSSYSSKTHGYPLNEGRDAASDYKYTSGYKKKLLTSNEGKKKLQASPASAMTTEEMQEGKSSSVDKYRERSSHVTPNDVLVNQRGCRNEKGERKTEASHSDDSDIIDLKTGAAGYWAKRYGTKYRIPSGRSPQNSKEAPPTTKPNSTTDNSSKYDERWIGTKLVKNEAKLDPSNKSQEETIIGFAQTITNELDQLQVDLSQRFCSKRFLQGPSISYDESMNPRYWRRYSISGNEISAKPYPYHRTSEGNHPSDVVPVISSYANEPGNNKDNLINNNATNNIKTSNNNNNSTNDGNDCKLADTSQNKDEALESTGDTPTPTPTPVPVQTSDNNDKSEKVNKPQANGYLSLTSEDEMSTTPTEADDSCSVCSDTNETGSARRSPCMEEESVSERIRRKSYFARFHDNRSRKHHHHNHHRKTLDVNRNHHMARMDDYHLMPTDAIGLSFHPLENSHPSGRRNSISHDLLDLNEDDGNYPTLTRKTARHNASTLPKNTTFHTDDKYDCDNPLPSTSAVQPLNDNAEETDQLTNYNSSAPKNESASITSNGYCETVPRALSPPTTTMFSSPVSPKLTRHLSLIDDNIEPASIPRPFASSYNFDRRKTSPSPLDACSQSRAKIRSRHDYIINRALSSIDEGMGITRPFSPTSRLSLLDNQLSDLRRFSAVLDNSSPRDVIRKALDVCNSLQY